MKNRKKTQRSFVIIFINRNIMVTKVGIVALIYCVICALYKGSNILNVENAMIRSMGELLCNIGISIIAAYIFYVFQSWLDFKRKGIVELYAKKYVKLYLLKDCEILQMQLQMFVEGKKTEELETSMAVTCEKIKNEMYICTTKYRDGLSDDLYKCIEELFFDNDFFLIENKVNQKLDNMSMKKIINSCGIYGCMQKLIEEMKREVNQ